MTDLSLTPAQHEALATAKANSRRLASRLVHSRTLSNLADRKLIKFVERFPSGHSIWRITALGALALSRHPEPQKSHERVVIEAAGIEYPENWADMSSSERDLWEDRQIDSIENAERSTIEDTRIEVCSDCALVIENDDDSALDADRATEVRNSIAKIDARIVISSDETIDFSSDRCAVCDALPGARYVATLIE